LIYQEFYLAALNILARKGEMPSDALHIEIKQQTERSLSLGGFYTVMNSLKRQGYVTSREGNAKTEEQRAARANRPILYYQITDAGRQSRAELLNEQTADVAPDIKGAAKPARVISPPAF
jgi:DNA-binding PadR family transcriptional regulator